MVQNMLVFSENFDTVLDEITQYDCQSLKVTQGQLPATTPTYLFAWVVWKVLGKIREAISSTSF